MTYSKGVTARPEQLNAEQVAALLRAQIAEGRKTGVWHGFWYAMNAERIETLLNALAAK